MPALSGQLGHGGYTQVHNLGYHGRSKGSNVAFETPQRNPYSTQSTGLRRDHRRSISATSLGRRGEAKSQEGLWSRGRVLAAQKRQISEHLICTIRGKEFLYVESPRRDLSCCTEHEPLERGQDRETGVCGETEADRTGDYNEANRNRDIVALHRAASSVVAV